MSETEKKDLYQNAFPPQVEEENHNPGTVEDLENPVKQDEETNYLDDLLVKKPKDVKRNFELYPEVNARLKKATNKYKHGFLKSFINAAIVKELDWLDEQEAKRKKKRPNKKTT